MPVLTPPSRTGRVLRQGREMASVLLKPAHLRRTLTIALVVGSWLTLVNLGDVLLQDGWSTALLTKAALNYLTPFIVANLGLLSRTGNRPANEVADVDKQT